MDRNCSKRFRGERICVCKPRDLAAGEAQAKRTTAPGSTARGYVDNLWITAFQSVLQIELIITLDRSVLTSL